MDERDELAWRFEESRTHLRSVAYRMLGSRSEADDAIQEAWLRLSRSDATAIENLTGWLTTVVARVCLDMLRSRKARREHPVGPELPEPAGGEGSPAEEEALLADSVGVALLVVLDTLNPAERLAFVLHDMFAVPFEEIAAIVGRSPEATRQLASRARRRVQQGPPEPERDPARQRAVLEAFLAASRGGDFEALLALLDPDVLLRPDATAVQIGAPDEVRGADPVARFFSVRRGARLVLVDGVVAAAWLPGGKPRVVFRFAIEDGLITEVEAIADPEHIARLTLVQLEKPGHGEIHRD